MVAKWAGGTFSLQVLPAGSVEDVTIGAGFGVPTAIFLWTSSATANATLTDDVMNCEGIGVSSTERYFSATFSDNGLSKTNTGYREGSNAILKGLNPVDGTVNYVLDLASDWATAVTDGFQLTYDDNPTAAFLVNYIVFGGDVEADVALVATSATQDATVTVDCPNIDTNEPDVVLCIGSGGLFNDVTNANDFTSTGFAVNDGGAGPYDNLSMSYVNVDNKANSTAGHQKRTDRCWHQLTSGGGEFAAFEITAFGASPNSITVTTRDHGTGPNFAVLALRFPAGESILAHEFGSTTFTGGTNVDLTTTAKTGLFLGMMGVTDTDDTVESTGDTVNQFSIGSKISVAGGGYDASVMVRSNSEIDGGGTSLSKSRMGTAESLYTHAETDATKLERGSVSFQSATVTRITFASGDNSSTDRKGIALTIEEAIPDAAASDAEYLRRNQHVPAPNTLLRM